LTAVSEFENGLIEIIDVEKVLSEIIPTNETVSTGLLEESHKAPQDKVVLVADDSAVARNQVKRTVEQLGLKTHTVINGKEALDWLLGIVKQGKNVNDEVLLVISDIEMPEMDGYTFTAEVRANPDLSDLHIILHTSLSGVFNKAMIEKVGANKFIAKFDPNELAAAVRSQYDQ